jgi:hypothetical protein
MTAQRNEGGRSVARFRTRRIATMAILFGLSLVTIAGCGEGDSATVPAVESNGSEEEPVAPDYEYDESAEPEYGSDEPVAPDDGYDESAESEYGSEEPAAPDQQPSTNPCAFPGDPLCPDTPVKVPPPDISNWP